MKDVPYAEATGSVLWPIIISRPDCAFAVSILAQFIQNPGAAHWEALKWVMVYPKNYWHTFDGWSKMIPEGYCDVDWAGQPNHHWISGYSFYFGQWAVMWSSKKQYVITLSSTEAEYIALAHNTKEAVWLRSFISEIMGEPEKKMRVNCNNQGLIAHHQCTKHINIRYHYIWEVVEDQKLEVSYIPTDESPADIFMKALLKLKFRKFIRLLGLRPELEEAKWKRGSNVELSV